MLWKPQDHRAAVLSPIIDSAWLQFAQLPPCQGEVDKFFLDCAQLQLLSFHLLALPFDDATLTRLYGFACTAIETLSNIDSLADCAPISVSKYLALAAFTILKLTRSHLQTLDLPRGRDAYFAVIQFHRKMSVQAGDAAARSQTILTQMWTSKTIFRKNDGSIDSLSLRCGSRLAMSIVFDSYWWWRQEFQDVPNPYEDIGEHPMNAAS